MSSTWQPPKDCPSRPVSILGGGVLGRRLACIWASAGYNVRVRDPSPQQREDCLAYVNENVTSYAEKTGCTPGTASAFSDLAETVKSAWLVIEAVPEKIRMKIDTFAELEAHAAPDSILASNSSSYRSSEMLEKVSESTKTRILNMHYYMPPQCMLVELMTDGFTAPGIFPFMVERSKEAGTIPYVARKESTGFIFNRLWAAIKRETLTIMAEGISVPEEIDAIWEEMFVNGRVLPCRMMDSVGLDTVAFIENHYVAERGLSSEKTVDFLQREYLDKGKLGNKSSKGGLHPPQTTSAKDESQPRIIALDVGLAASPPSATAGQILELSADGKIQRAVVKNQALPDGITVDSSSKRMFWTNMGTMTKADGAVYSANLDGSDIKTLVPPGEVDTPKQLTLDQSAQKLYFSDREGLRVFRCDYDGSEREVIVQTGDSHIPEQRSDATKWCVGIAVSPQHGKVYWTQKGPSKGGKGRIFCANIKTPQGQTATDREDIVCLLENLSEPIDLEVDEVSNTLYWTDRGELPFGNSLNRIALNSAGLVVKDSSSRGYEILARNFHETIGLKLDLANGHIYCADLGGSIYRIEMTDGKKTTLYTGEDRAFTGIALI
ncbi:putative 3-hydroxyacyl-CoA dehydrogenase [Aspergillus stella-maris]|uniref:putative 3-hydroxyacyl-CoA dehydrogenase n=1 Tax=Aspergillus stella-maris TaxID=1810926 RepID=UPI003CCD1352